MNYSEAVTIVNSNYLYQADKITSNLSQEAVIALANCVKGNEKRNLADATIDRLSRLEPWQQAGWISNPWIQWAIESCNASMCAPRPVTSTTTITTDTTKVTPNKPTPDPKPKPAPEPIDDDGPMIDLFG